MANIVDPNDATAIARVTKALGGVRMSPVPLDTTGGGSYSAYFEVTPIAGQGPNAEIVQFRNPTSVLAIVERIDLTSFIVPTTAFGGVGLARFRTAIARGWSVDGTGGTTLNFAGDNNQMRQTHAAAGCSIRVCNGAALGAGTKTFDASATLNATPFQSHKGIMFGVTATLNANMLGAPTVNLFGEQENGHPLMLGLNEGFSLLMTVPGTGVPLIGVAVRWTESTNY